MIINLRFLKKLCFNDSANAYVFKLVNDCVVIIWILILLFMIMIFFPHNRPAIGCMLNLSAYMERLSPRLTLNDELGLL